VTTMTISVAPDVRVLLPDVLIDYLCGLALSAAYQDREEQTFVLSPAELGGRSIQNIVHLDEMRRVFGIEPVSCKLCVRAMDAGYAMTLAS